MRNDARHTIHTVSELAKLSGTSVRTLHHYDAIGLLKPATVGENGYRYYGRGELMRLQQILVHREFGVALRDIPALLDAQGSDRLAALREQRARLEETADRYRRLAQTIDRTIAELEGRTTIMDKQLFEGFSPQLESDYEAWLIDRYGEPAARDRLARGAEVFAAMSDAQKTDWMAEAIAMRDDFASTMARGTASDDPSLDPLLKRHHAWVVRTTGTPATADAYTALGRLNVDNLEFRAMYDAAQPGLAQWMAEAMASFARRALI
ncbi:MerR family transcriptional regulator [Caulobacter vibrioides]|uniref:MerR family transcriptional regulator n=1 Tax=Caulobacter vibrioides TaxID=155892 RepID=A0A290N185_CAUVI|nr:MerR family transcriptional regulator [Caulobacter vibrioides]ATC34462.1 MerR family transcriptional regulator [Caulobacter vibrioides]